jgi:hypothetical protein
VIKLWAIIFCCIAWPCALTASGGPVAQTVTLSASSPCACGAHPPGPPEDREDAPYANQPSDLRPFSKLLDSWGRSRIIPNRPSGCACCTERS